MQLHSHKVEIRDCNSGVECNHDKVEVAGSNPASPTI